MPDTDLQTIKEANAAVLSIDVRYREASFPEKRELKPMRDAAFNAYTVARANLLAEGVITTADDVKEMRALRKQVNEAADTQQLIIAAGRVVGFLIRFAV